MKILKKNELFKLKDFLILWSTQSISQLGSSITAFALTLWLYERTGSSLSTAALTICSYAPYVLMSIFAGVLTDRFNKKRTMLSCDLFAAIRIYIISDKLFEGMALICFEWDFRINEYRAAACFRGCYDTYCS